MHEFGLAMHIVEIAEEHARPLLPQRVTQIELELGDFAAVMHDSLLFSLRTALAASACRGAEVVIHRIPGEGLCPACGKRSPMAAIYGDCPRCGAPGLPMVRGREFRVVSIQVG